MTRQIKGPGTAVLEREYVYSEPPISLTDLADKHGLARSNVAAKAQVGKWYEKREEFRARLAEKTREALAEKWVQAETDYREKLLKVGATYLDAFVKAMDEGEIKVNTKDMLGIAAMMRTIMGDIKAEGAPDTVVVTEDGDVQFADPDEAKVAMAKLTKLLESGEEEDVDS